MDFAILMSYYRTALTLKADIKAESVHIVLERNFCEAKSIFWPSLRLCFLLQRRLFRYIELRSLLQAWIHFGTPLHWTSDEFCHLTSLSTDSTRTRTASEGAHVRRGTAVERPATESVAETGVEELTPVKTIGAGVEAGLTVSSRRKGALEVWFAGSHECQTDPSSTLW